MTWRDEPYGAEQEGTCGRCGVVDLLFDGLCTYCVDDPTLTAAPATTVAHAPLVTHRECTLCGREHISAAGELCPRCQRETAEEMDEWLNSR